MTNAARQQFDLQRPERIPDQMGGYGVVWSKIGSLWIDVEPMTPKMKSGKIGPKISGRYMGKLRIPLEETLYPHIGERLSNQTGVYRIETLKKSPNHPLYLECLLVEEQMG